MRNKDNDYGPHHTIILQDRIYTYDYVNRQANKVAHTALKLGLKKGDVVSILITNSPEFIWTFIGKWFKIHTNGSNEDVTWTN